MKVNQRLIRLIPDIALKTKTALRRLEMRKRNYSMMYKVLVAICVLLPTAHVHADDTDVFFAVNNDASKLGKTNIMFIMDESNSMSINGQFTFDPISCGTVKNGNIEITQSCYDPTKDYKHPTNTSGSDVRCYDPSKWYFFPNNDLSRVRADDALAKCWGSVSKATIRADRPLDPSTSVCKGLAQDVNTKGGRTGNFMGLYKRYRSGWFFPTQEMGWYPLDVHGSGNLRAPPLGIKYGSIGGLRDTSKIKAIECIDDVSKHGATDASNKKYPKANVNESQLNSGQLANAAWTSNSNESQPNFSLGYGGIYSGNYLNYLRYTTEKKYSSRNNIFKKALKRYIERSNNIRMGLASFKNLEQDGGSGNLGAATSQGRRDGGNIDVPVVDVDMMHEKWRWLPDNRYTPLTDRKDSSMWNRNVSHREWLWWKADEYFTSRAAVTGAQGLLYKNIPGIGVKRYRGLELAAKLSDDVPYRPLGETLFEVGRYFKGEKVKFGAYSRPEAWSPVNTWGGPYADRTRAYTPWRDGWGWQTSILDARVNKIYTGGPEDTYPTNKTNRNYVSPIDDECQANAAVIFTDYTGEKIGNGGSGATAGVSFAQESGQATKSNGAFPPYADADEISLIESLWPGLDCSADVSAYGSCLPAIAGYLANTDLAPSVAGNKPQTLKTFVVSFWDENIFSGREPKGIEMLRKATRNGKGKFIRFGADLSELDKALGEIINLVGLNPIGSGTFVAPASSVDLSSRLQNKNEIYYSLFEPSEQNRWRGNLKRYKLQYVDESGSKKLKVVNADCDTSSATPCTVAVDADNKFTTAAKSAWLNSNIADGADVKKGGASEKQENPRNVLTDYGLGTDKKLKKLTHALLNVNQGGAQLKEWAREFDIELTSTLESDENLLKLYLKRRINFARGYGVDKEADDATKQAFRRIGDPLHSQPKIVVYKAPLTDSTGNLVSDEKDAIVFFGTNEGYLHAVDTKTGKEVFSFLPQATYNAVGKYYENEVSKLGSKIYGLDGEIEIWVNDLNGNGVVKTSTGQIEQDASGNKEGVYLFVGMRRGGTSYYALDVTEIDQPKLMWKIERETPPANITAAESDANTKFYELGQSWNKPQVIKAKFNGKEKPLLVIAGGYDEGQDDEMVRKPDFKGRAIYVLDALTGERKWATGYVSAAGGAVDFNGFNVDRSDMKYSFPATPAVLDANGDTYIDTIVAADAGGQIWRVDINESNTGASNFATVDRIAVLASDRGGNASGTRLDKNNRKFFVTPDIMVDSSGAERSLMIALGSGRRPEPLSAEVENHFYVLRSKPAIGPRRSTSGAIEARPTIQLNDLMDATSTSAYQSGADNNTLAQFNENGFYIKLGQVATGSNIDVGEKVITEASIFNGYVVFASYIPSEVPAKCGEALGSNRLNAINYNNPDARYVSDLAQKGIAPKPSILILNDGTKRKPALVVGTEVFDKSDMPDPLKNLYSLSRDKLIRFWVEDK